MANACALDVRRCLASAGTWQTRDDVALAMESWSAGRVDDEARVDPAAVRQQRSVSLACAPLVHDGIKVK